MDGCRRYGIDPATAPIPVVPATHYFCGGVRVDLDEPPTFRGSTRWARSPTPACTARTAWPRTPPGGPGFRGARGAHLRRWVEGAPPPPADPGCPRARLSREDVIINHNWQEVRRLMWTTRGWCAPMSASPTPPPPRAHSPGGGSVLSTFRGGSRSPRAPEHRPGGGDHPAAGDGAEGEPGAALQPGSPGAERFAFPPGHRARTGGGCELGWYDTWLGWNRT